MNTNQHIETIRSQFSLFARDEYKKTCHSLGLEPYQGDRKMELQFFTQKKDMVILHIEGKNSLTIAAKLFAQLMDRLGHTHRIKRDNRAARLQSITLVAKAGYTLGSNEYCEEKDHDSKRGIRRELLTEVMEALTSQYNLQVHSYKDGMYLDLTTTLPHDERRTLIELMEGIDIAGFTTLVINGHDTIRVDLLSDTQRSVQDEVVHNAIEDAVLIEEQLYSRVRPRLEGMAKDHSTLCLTLIGELGVQSYSRILTRIGQTLNEHYRVVGYPNKDNLFLTIEVVK